ncbi:MAG: hypothetical protein ACOCXT_04010 [Candidatus Dojkabacteria bacterium]
MVLAPQRIELFVENNTGKIKFANGGNYDDSDRFNDPKASYWAEYLQYQKGQFGVQCGSGEMNEPGAPGQPVIAFVYNPNKLTQLQRALIDFVPDYFAFDTLHKRGFYVTPNHQPLNEEVMHRFNYAWTPYSVDQLGERAAGSCARYVAYIFQCFSIKNGLSLEVSDKKFHRAESGNAIAIATFGLGPNYVTMRAGKYLELTFNGQEPLYLSRRNNTVPSNKMTPHEVADFVNNALSNRITSPGNLHPMLVIA